MPREAELIRALAEDLALEILTSYTAQDLRMQTSAVSGMQPSTSRSTEQDQGRHYSS